MGHEIIREVPSHILRLSLSLFSPLMLNPLGGGWSHSWLQPPPINTSGTFSVSIGSIWPLTIRYSCICSFQKLKINLSNFLSLIFDIYYYLRYFTLLVNVYKCIFIMYIYKCFNPYLNLGLSQASFVRPLFELVSMVASSGSHCVFGITKIAVCYACIHSTHAWLCSHTIHCSIPWVAQAHVLN